MIVPYIEPTWFPVYEEKSVIVPYIERTTWFPVYDEKSVIVPYIERTTWFPVYDEKSERTT